MFLFLHTDDASEAIILSVPEEGVTNADTDSPLVMSNRKSAGLL